MLYFLKVLEKFRNKYRIPSARMRNWDYGSNAPYFITICTAHRECYFGSIINGEMNLTPIGKIVADEWLKTPEIRTDMNIFLDVFVLMPDHLHGIILIGKNRYNNLLIDNDNKTTQCGIIESNPKNNFGPQIKNLASIIRGFKSSVTINARKINPDFAWQPRFHEHVIRDYRSYERIRNYIIDNPKKWDNDILFI